MGTLLGHVAPGFSYFVIGLWHLINHIKLHALNPKSYTSSPWFPTSRIKYAELYWTMAGCSMSISMELFIGPNRHQPLDPDGTIPPNHLHNFEHSLISLTFFMYAFLAIILDKAAPPAKYGLTCLLAAVTFGQQLLLFHLHSTDHMGVEGQYHWLLQIAICTALATTLVSINYPKSFLNSFVRSISIMFQGIWLIVMGFMLWTPTLIFKGCFLNSEEGHKVVRCHGEDTLERAKSLANIQFCCYVIGVTIFSVALYLVMVHIYQEKMEHQFLPKFELRDDDNNDDDDDAGAQNKANNMAREKKTILEIGSLFVSMDMKCDTRCTN